MEFPLFEEKNLKFPHPNSIILGKDSIKIQENFPVADGNQAEHPNPL